MREVGTAHIGLDVTGLVLHNHEACSQEALVVPDAVRGSHQGILFAAGCIYGHLNRLVEGVLNLGFRITVSLHLNITGTLTLGTLKAVGRLVSSQRTGIGGIPIGSQLPLEYGLQLIHHMLYHSLLGILLHTRVDGCVHFKSVGIDVIAGSVALCMLVAPSVCGIGFPGQRVLIELLVLPAGIVASLGFPGRQHLPQIVTQVGRRAFLMVIAVEIQAQGLQLQLLHLGSGNIAGLLHLSEHYITALHTALGVPDGIEIAGILAHTYQCGALSNIQILGILAEVSPGGCLDTYCIVKEIEIVQVHGQNLLLRIVLLQFQGNYPFYRFLQESLLDVSGLLGVQLLGQLLGDGTAAAGTLPHQDTTFYNGSEKGLEINTAMIVETLVLSSYKCLNYSW